MKSMTKRIQGIATAAAVFAFSSLAWLHVASADSITLQDPLGGQQFIDVANSIIWFIQADIATPLCVVMALVGGFQLMTSAGEPEKVSKGRKTIMWAAVGYVVAIIAGGLATLLKNIINGH